MSLTMAAGGCRSANAGGLLAPNQAAALSAEAGASSPAAALVRNGHCLEDRRLIGKLGRYTVLGQIANGGMGSVFVAQMRGSAAFTRLVAIKSLHTRWLEDAEYVARFTLEAKLSASIHHPNVVQTLDVVEAGGELFLVMEYVDGVTLAALLTDLRRAHRTLPVGMALGILSAALRGLHAAHEATDSEGVPLHIVHRDVSPQNILIGRNGHVQVLDFGAAKAVDSQHTSAGKVVGRLAYMAPEQMRGESSSRGADVFSAGVVLWEALVGRRLFQNCQVDRSNPQHALTPVARPSRWRSEVPRAVDEVLEKALAQTPERRFQTALEFAFALESIGGAPSAIALAQLVSECCAERLAKNDAWRRSALAEAAQPPASTPILRGLPSTQRPSLAGVAFTAAPRPQRHSHVAWLGAVLLAGSAFSWTLDAGQTPDASRQPTLVANDRVLTLAAARDPDREQRNGPAPHDVTESYMAAAPPATNSREETSVGDFANAAASALGSSAFGFMAAGETKLTLAEPKRFREERLRSAALRAKPLAGTAALAKVHYASWECETPTYMDAAGIRHFKEDCL